MDRKKGYVIAVVGSGGKTTLIARLAKQSREAGMKTAVMTTTHMWLPRCFSGAGMRISEAKQKMEQEGIVVFGQKGQGREEGKLVFPGQAAYEELCRQADLTLVEADGSRGLPMKYPDQGREPVIPGNVDAIFVVFGLSAVGKPLNQVCHRWQLGCGLRPGEGEEQGKRLVEPELASDFLERGYLRPLSFAYPAALLSVILNQAEGENQRKAGLQIKALLEKKGRRVQLACLKPFRIAVIYMASGRGTRFGGNKLTALVQGKPLYRHGLEVFLQVKKELEKEGKIQTEIILVSRYPEILDAGRRLEEGETVDWNGRMMGGEPEEKFFTAENIHGDEGIAASIRRGILGAGEADAFLFSVADQPWIQPDTIRGLINGFSENLSPGEKDIGCLASENRRGNPVIFHGSLREKLLSLQGDRGGSRIMKELPDRVMEFPAEERELTDIDYPDQT